ncbi:MAG: hypothetical protein M0Q94_14650, partial [Candidatus Cloacimonetes bacterium]|nr:hypothetical protein [Candidatus Cloacimonadota bacterium]
ITATGCFLREHDCYAKDYEYPYSFKESEGKGKGASLPQRLCVFCQPFFQLLSSGIPRFFILKIIGFSSDNSWNSC